MRKERLFPFWTELEQVIPVAHGQTAGNLQLTLVSMERYAVYGFLLTFNIVNAAPDPAFNLSRRGWIQPYALDDTGNRYTSLLTMISSIAHGQTFRGRAVVPFLPRLTPDAERLTVTIDHVEWEHLNEDNRTPESDKQAGPWTFEVVMKGA